MHYWFFELYCEKERLLQDQFELLKTLVDIGDILGACGTIKRTEKVVLSLLLPWMYRLFSGKGPRQVRPLFSTSHALFSSYQEKHWKSNMKLININIEAHEGVISFYFKEAEDVRKSKRLTATKALIIRLNYMSYFYVPDIRELLEWNILVSYVNWMHNCFKSEHDLKGRFPCSIKGVVYNMGGGFCTQICCGGVVREQSELVAANEIVESVPRKKISSEEIIYNEYFESSVKCIVDNYNGNLGSTHGKIYSSQIEIAQGHNGALILEGLHISHNHVIYTPLEIATNPTFYPYLKDCIGAIDGTHIPAWVRLKDQVRYRNRKGFLLQNVMAVVSFDRKFQYVFAGWEGSASDSKVLQDALSRPYNRLRVPTGKFYLVDGGYANTRGFVPPYRGIRYHLKEWSTTQAPQTPQELFNLRHSKSTQCSGAYFYRIEATLSNLKNSTKISS